MAENTVAATGAETGVDQGAATGAHEAAGNQAHTAVEHAEPALLGVAPPVAVVSTSMLVLILIMIWKGVPKLISGGLDSRISQIKAHLEEAKTLRAEAEALRKEYADKIANAEKDAAAMLEHAQHEAEAIVAKAEADTTELIARRHKMVEEKISALELATITDLRRKAAAAAALAAGELIKANHSADADKALVDKAIAGI
ncbi:hypothetical protein WBP06_10125 [Novosphingobium sp. BL-8H]|uniref:F0F1 ATP synthase subunit B family protein n=1 Tax=Novosphingobium sp. BL-8H TaxID=3127640 RepID=UPI003757554C